MISQSAPRRAALTCLNLIGLRNKQKEIVNNDKLIKKKSKMNEEVKNNKGKKTKIETWSVDFYRATFSMTFDWSGSELGEEPSDKNDWGMRLNLCWPQAIVPEDPGWAVNSDDDWYEVSNICVTSLISKTSQTHVWLQRPFINYTCHSSTYAKSRCTDSFK